jgi:hypothetical protein
VRATLVSAVLPPFGSVTLIRLQQLETAVISWKSDG